VVISGGPGVSVDSLTRRERKFYGSGMEAGVGVERLRNLSRLSGILALAGLVAFGSAHPAMAARVRRHHRRHYEYHTSGPLYHAILLEDADTGSVLYAQNADLQWPPASMAKMMLLMVAADQIRAGRMRITDPVRISERAATTGGSRLGMHEGDVYPLGELMKAALIKSANDAAVAIAEKIAGSVEACVRMMNEKARELGMNDTYYGTVNGLPPRPDHDVDHTTAADLAKLARSIIHNTDLLEWSRLETAPFDGGERMLHNTNHLIGHYDGCDGLKTGFTVQAGFNLTATAMRGDMRLVSVVLGAPSNPQRFAQTARILNWGFDNFTKVHVLRRGDPLPVHVQVQSGPLIQPIAESDIALVVRKTETADVKLEYNVPGMVNGPIASGDPLGQVVVMDGGEVVTKVDAVCPIGFGDAPQRAGDTMSVTSNIVSSNRGGTAESAGLPGSSDPR
jgi:serine-type D-Ala-D-Ala carboxypeptidase (penicillin-binding protein 5/6)